MLSNKQQYELAAELIKQFGVSKSFAYILAAEHGNLWNINDTVEHAAKKIYLAGNNINLMEVDKRVIFETQIMNADMILRGAMRLLQTEHSKDSIALQNRLQSVFYQLQQINNSFGDIFKKDDGNG